jgi:hypothetical protein
MSSPYEPFDEEVELHETTDTTEGNHGIAQQEIDRLTLELLVNKGQYRKYLEKSNPAEYDKKREFYSRFQKYKGHIERLMFELLNDYSVSGNSPHLGNVEIQDVFGALVQKCVGFFNSAEETERTYYKNSQPEEEDTMFGEMDEPIETNEGTATLGTSFSAPFANHYRPGKSVWGKNIHKTY